MRLKENPKISEFAKSESYWFKRKGMVHFKKLLKWESFVWIGGTAVPPVHTELSCFSDF